MATDPTPTPKPKRSSVQSNIWAFNLRSTTTNLDSDSDDSAEDTTADISEETRLLNDLDLSSREEPGVLYKPNPFSIAKINAASRPTRPAQPLTVRRPAKPVQKKPQGRIVDSFKKTVEKKLATPATVPAPVPRTTPAPSVVIPPTSDISKDMRQEVVVESLSTDAQNTTPPEEKLIAAVEHSSAHISTIPSAALSQPNHSNKRFRAPAQIPFSSPLPPPLKSRNAAILNQSSLSSPLRAPHYLGRSAPPLEPFMSNNRVAQYPHKIPPGPPVQTFHNHSSPRTLVSNPNFKGPRPGSGRHYHSPLHATTVYSNSAQRQLNPAIGNFQALQPNPLLVNRSSHRPTPPPAFLETDVPVESASTPSNENASYHSQSFSPSSVFCQHALNILPKLPPSSPIQSPIPSPSPRKTNHAHTRVSLQKPTPALKRQKSDAYNYFKSDPDDEWSTLSVRKKMKISNPSKIHGIRTTAAFRLPGSTDKGKITGISASSTRRVVTFLPPPLLKAGTVEVVVENVPNIAEQPARAIHVEAQQTLKHLRASSSPISTPKRRRLSENPYPSPADSRLTPGGAPTPNSPSSVAASSSPLVIPQSKHRIPSPPTSDPSPVEDFYVDTHLTIDAFTERYPPTKTLMRKRKKTDTMWDLLELPSCGIVYTEGAGLSQDEELPVAVWQGQGTV